MLASRILENALVALLALLLALNAAFKTVTWLWINRASLQLVGDVPWHNDQKEVVLEWDAWTRYNLHSSAEWSTLYPDNGIVHLGPDNTPYTISMFHQLRCLDVVRDQLTRPKAWRDAEPTRHCMNYLRQMSSCHADLDFEPNQYVHEINPVHPNPVHRCLDWRPIYEELRRNREEYVRWTVGSGRNGTTGS